MKKNTDSIDIWYGDNAKDTTKIDIIFYGDAAEYRGNIYIGDKPVGDYTSSDSLKIERWFSQLNICWD